ncbi:MAG: UTP--glucose-1-phosphate uridylyltransferase [Sandaracinaceae bacterium]|nr:UTP--glucose-1-phosphate uridylyltransferase [Sandaracinaceae bacterium]
MEIDESTRKLLEQFGFEEKVFQELLGRLAHESSDDAQNRIQKLVEVPEADDVYSLPPKGSKERDELHALGTAAIARGEVASVVLAGGMATRFGGVVKAAVDALPGRSFLDLKLAQIERVAETAKGRVPVYLMTSFATDAEIRSLARSHKHPSVPVEAFPQAISLRVTPTGELFYEKDGSPSPYAPGHGDLIWALRRAGILHRFLASGGKVLVMSNVDNLAATLDPAVVGAHLKSGAQITAEVTEKEPGEKGGAPARVDGVPQIVEAFRFPTDFDQDSIPVFNTNTLLFDATTLDRDFPLSWFTVRKKVDGRDAVQFERLVGEMTALLPSRFLRVPRYGVEGRFQPAKDPEELKKRQPDIERVMKACGVL